MVLVLPVLNLQDHKRMVSVHLIFALEMNSYMNGVIASHVQKVDYTINLEGGVKQVHFF